MRSGNMSEKKKKQKRSRKYIIQRRKRNLVLAGMGITAILLIWGIVSLSIFTYVAIKNDDTIAEGIYIANIDVGGLTIEEATTEVNAMLGNYSEASVVIQVTDSEDEFPATTLSGLGFDMINEDDVIQEAWEYGKSEGFWENFKKLQGLKEEEQVYYPNYTVDEALVEEYLMSNYSGVEIQAIDAYISMEEGELVYHDGVDGTVLDIENTVNEIETVLNTEWEGTDLTFDIPLTSKAPEIEKEELLSVQDVLGTYQTTLEDDGGRYSNVSRAAELLNGLILMPGEEISMASATGPYTEENGYTEAGAYENGEVVQSLGGGICQVSSTMYNAVLFAELEVTQRQAHSMTVSYVDPGRDAAIAGDYKDLKFSNNTASPVYIYAVVSGGTLTVTLYGEETRAENRTIELESIIVETASIEVEYTADSSQDIGYINTTSYGKEGKTAELWKYVYVDGVEESSEKINTSYYSGSSKTVVIGTNSTYSEASSIVSSAVSSGNIDTINAAITEAKALVATKDAAAAQAAADAAAAADTATESE